MLCKGGVSCADDGADLSTGTTMMPPPGEGELAGTDHAHCGPQVWDPDGSLWAQRGPAVDNNVCLIEQRLKVNQHSQMTPSAHTDLQLYLFLTSAGYESDFLLRVVVYGPGDGFQPLVSLCGWAANTKHTMNTFIFQHLTSNGVAEPWERMLTLLREWKSVQHFQYSARSDRPPGWAYSPGKHKIHQNEACWSDCWALSLEGLCLTDISKCGE